MKKSTTPKTKEPKEPNMLYVWLYALIVSVFAAVYIYSNTNQQMKTTTNNGTHIVTEEVVISRNYEESTIDYFGSDIFKLLAIPLLLLLLPKSLNSIRSAYRNAK